MFARILLTIALAVFPAGLAAAQTTGGIPGPGITEGERAVQLRGAWAPGEGGQRDRWAARLHYQQALGDDLRWRVVLQGTDFETGDFETTFLQGELQWEIDDDPGWGKALRFDARLSEDDDAADALGLVSINQFALGPKTFARADVFTNLQVGSRRTGGVGAEFRGQLGYRAGARTTLVLESFNTVGRGKSFGKFGSTPQRAGPGVSYGLGNGASVFGSVLFGLNDSAADTDLRLWLTKSL